MKIKFDHKLIVWYLFLPILIYLILFLTLTFPLILNFSSQLFADMGDGLQSYWNLWWVNKSVLDLHQLPWFTNYLHYPYGITLLGHTLSAFNGFLAILLHPFLSFLQIYNFLVIFSFVVGGLTTFWLGFYIGRDHFEKRNLYLGSILGGFIFSFSHYHFAQAQGHLQLISLEWIPLFILSWLIFIKNPTKVRAILSSGALFLVLLCDHYYFFYCLIVALILFLSNLLWKEKKEFQRLVQKQIGPYLFFIVVTSFTAGALVLPLLYLSSIDLLTGSHSESRFSTDLLAPFIPGAHWGYAPLTQGYWGQIQGNFTENNAFLGLSVIGLVIYVWFKRKVIKVPYLTTFFFIILFFLVLSWGPILHIWGNEISFIPLPYSLLDIMVPGFALSGVPSRMIVIVTLFCAIIFSLGVSYLLQSKNQSKFILLALISLLLIEYLPYPIPSNKLETPPYVQKMAQLPGNDAILDLESLDSDALYYQTIHQKPISFGYVSRVPSSVNRKDLELTQSILSFKFCSIHQAYAFRYIILDKNQEKTLIDHLKNPIYEDNKVIIFDLNSCDQ